MNVAFLLSDKQLDAKFVTEAANEGPHKFQGFCFRLINQDRNQISRNSHPVRELGQDVEKHWTNQLICTLDHSCPHDNSGYRYFACQSNLLPSIYFQKGMQSRGPIADFRSTCQQAKAPNRTSKQRASWQCRELVTLWQLRALTPTRQPASQFVSDKAKEVAWLFVIR